MDRVIYLDNTATSWPKPPEVPAAMTRFITEIGANPGRSAHRLSIEAARIVYDAREAVSSLFGTADPLRVVFAGNITEALNLALRGLLRPGDHVITTSMEHNAVMRPLRALERQGVSLTVIPCSPQGLLDPADVAAAIRPATTMIVLNHASNVTGTLLPVAEVGAIARRHDLLMLVDAAQTAGALPFEMEACQIDLLAFTGHKSLLGPTGTGGLIIGERVPLERFDPLVRGGTGSRSEHEEQPAFLPDIFESGTQNVVGLAGLEAGVRWILERGVESIRAHEIEQTARLLAGLNVIEGVTLYGADMVADRTAVVSFTLGNLSPAEIGMRLDDDFGILCRVGLHCAPAAHRTIGTFPVGTVRFGPGPFTTANDIDTAIAAVRTLADRGNKG